MRESRAIRGHDRAPTDRRTRAVLPDRRRLRRRAVLHRRADDRAAGRARENGRQVRCGPNGPDREALAEEFQQAHRMGGVPPGSIVRPRG